LSNNRYKWAASGDVNAFFGLMLDNIAGLVLLVSLLAGFGFPVDFALAYMVPGTALGVLVGDLLFFFLAFRYAKATGKNNVTAMPLGLDTPSTFGMALFVLGPAFLAAKGAGMDDGAAAMHTWHIGMCAILITGVIKAVLSGMSGWVHRMVPRAGLLGSLAAIALVLIAFGPLAEIAKEAPVVGLASLALVLVTLIGRQRLPYGIPGALAAVVVGSGIYYLLFGLGHATGVELVERVEPIEPVWFPQMWLEAFRFEWLNKFDETVPYLGFVIPFAVATVIGGIDCAESAASVGDDFHTPTVIGIEAFATLLAACCGGVIQTTPYIGHPAYKAMGGRAAYTLATALFIGAAGLIGFFSVMFTWIPKAAIFPILIFIGIEITAQSFHVTPKKHYAAVAVACLPALAKLVVITATPFVVAMGFQFEDPELAKTWLYMNVLAGGFIFTSVIWASATANMVDRKYLTAGVYFLLGGVFTLFGVMHSPLAGDKMFSPTALWNEAVFDEAKLAAVRDFAIAYFVMGAIMIGLWKYLPQEEIDADESVLETANA
jgi:AGZA family xanthine/uracil permease-like MFS transporter